MSSESERQRVLEMFGDIITDPTDDDLVDAVANRLRHHPAMQGRESEPVERRGSESGARRPESEAVQRDDDLRSYVSGKLASLYGDETTRKRNA